MNIKGDMEIKSKMAKAVLSESHNYRNIEVRTGLACALVSHEEEFVRRLEESRRETISMLSKIAKGFHPEVVEIFGEIDCIDPYYGKIGLCPFSQPMKREKPFNHYCIELMVKDMNGRLPRGKCRKQEIKQCLKS